MELAALLLVGVLEPVELREMAESHRGMAPVAVVVEVAGVSRRRSRGIPCPKATGYLHPRRGGRARFVRDGARLDGDLPGRTRLGARIVRDAERHLIRAGLAFGGRPRKRPRYGVQFHAPQGLAGLAPPPRDAQNLVRVLPGRSSACDAEAYRGPGCRDGRGLRLLGGTEPSNQGHRDQYHSKRNRSTFFPLARCWRTPVWPGYLSHFTSWYIRRRIQCQLRGPAGPGAEA